jgi:hypothetical protein
VRLATGHCHNRRRPAKSSGRNPQAAGKLAEGYDVVYGAPEEEQHGLWRDLASRVTKIALQSAVGAETARHASAFPRLPHRGARGFVNFQGPFVSIDVLLTWGASRFAAVRVPHDARRLGTSQYTLRKLIRHAFNMMTGFSVLPLQSRQRQSDSSSPYSGSWCWCT